MSNYKKQPIPKELRQAVFKRDGYTCRYCGRQTKRPHADHVYPERKGGETSINNLVTACGRCNVAKRATVGIWPNPISVTKILSENKRLSRSELLQKNVIKHLRKTIKNKNTETHDYNNGKPVRLLILVLLLAGIIYNTSIYSNEYAELGVYIFFILISLSAGIGITAIIGRTK